MTALALALPARGALMAAEKGGLDQTGPYRVVENWFKPGVARWNQPVTGVAVDTPNRILVVSSGEQITQAGSLILGRDGVPQNPVRDFSAPKIEHPSHEHLILALNAKGEVVEDWSQWNDSVMLPHSVQISPYDPERHVWVVDRDGDQILEFTNDGKKLVLRLGEKGVAGTDHGHFDWPASLLFLPDGSFFVADGYHNSRVVKFDKTGKYLMEWGTKGNGPGQFNLLHDVAIDAGHHVYVADRGNNRIQVFSQDGKYLDQWPDIHNPSRMRITQDGSLWLVSGDGNRLAKFDLHGKLLTYWGMHGRFAGGFDDPHAIDVDADGNLYVAEVWNNRVEKFVPRAGADRSRLIGPRFIPASGGK
ncbi:MAG TPA: peptidyl-alpha-hydroxyglycine alpha-amidating lyase family protein [Rhizomicrobium sp.]|nr:peptidyl-alpha-hydroxyglycine alpha-amidating lyase family protein [Rhizomicrobium sp.]